MHLRPLDDSTKHIIDRGIQQKNIYNIYKTVFGQKSITKRLFYVQGLKNVWENYFRPNLI